MNIDQEEPLVVNPDEISSVNKGKSKKRKKRQQENEDLRKVVSTEHGRRFYWKILDRCKVMKITYVAGDPYATAFNEGARFLGNSLLKEIHNVAPNSYVKMWNEYLESNKKENEDGTK